MKPTVPETGRVIKLESSNAIVMFEGGRSCRGCGAAKIGLCRAGGNAMFLTARNSVFAKPGDKVIVGLDRKTQRLCYLLAYLIPLFGFVGGAIMGSLLGDYFDLPSLDVLTACILLALSAAFSFRKLREVDKSRQMEAKRIVSIGEFTEFITTEEERRYLNYADQC